MMASIPLQQTNYYLKTSKPRDLHRTINGEERHRIRTCLCMVEICSSCRSPLVRIPHHTIRITFSNKSYLFELMALSIE